MNDSVDLANLRSITDGNKELELMLFNEFCISAETSIQTMAENCVENWRSAAHALKGSAYNLGAHILGDLCKKAQDNPAIDGTEKEELLNAIKAEYIRVKAFLGNVHV